ncbi:MAG: pyridoxal phosphate-dependent aminotransferase [bacterium]|nr:pyridoxal phosphate-dependent aminotransferase [bacterium]
MLSRLSKRSASIEASVTLTISSTAKALKAEGHPVISFGAGEPDFDTPEYIKFAAKRAIDDGFTKYTPSAGIIELKNAICEKLKVDNSLDYNPSQIVVSNGAKHSLYNAIFAICDEGDEVIVFSPYWVTYIEQIKLAGAVPVVVETKGADNFRIDFAKLFEKITAKTKAIIINSPSNPTGVVYSEEELKKLADIAIAKDFYIISDEIYEKIIYDAKHFSIAIFSDEIKDRTIVINGVSKAYSMTGWRIGYLAAPQDIASAINNVQSHMTSNAGSVSQKASLAAISEEYLFEENNIKFQERRDYMVEKLNSLTGLECPTPQGAFYVFPDISKYLGKTVDGEKINNTVDFCRLLLEKEKIAVIPGDAFGDVSCIRFSYATAMSDIKEGLDRFEQFLKTIN